MASSVLPAKPGLPPRWAGAARAPPAGDKSQGTAAPWQRGGDPGRGTRTRTRGSVSAGHTVNISWKSLPVRARAAGTALGPLPGKQVPGEQRFSARHRGGRPQPSHPVPGGGARLWAVLCPPGQKLSLGDDFQSSLGVGSVRGDGHRDGATGPTARQGGHPPLPRRGRPPRCPHDGHPGPPATPPTPGFTPGRGN